MPKCDISRQKTFAAPSAFSNYYSIHRVTAFFRSKHVKIVNKQNSTMFDNFSEHLSKARKSSMCLVFTG